MNCPHCNEMTSPSLPFDRAVDGGRAYARTCRSCGHVLDLRPRGPLDPPVEPPDLTHDQIVRLRFERWRVAGWREDLEGPGDSPLTAA